jgi:putative NADH-flavin reductase
LLAGHEAVIAAYNPDRETPGDVYERMVAGARSIIDATKKARVKRLLVVGGAGSLEVAPGQQIIDQPDFPPEWKAGAGGTRQFLYLLKEEPDLDWTFLSPAATLEPGERTGAFRLGGDQILVDAEGQCRISTQDYAVAMIDELEEPKHTGERFCVAY